MPLEVPFSPSIVLVVVVVDVVNVVYVVVSLATDPSLLPSFASPLRPSRREICSRQNAFYIRSAEFFHDFHPALWRSFSQTARVYLRTHVVHAHRRYLLPSFSSSSGGVITFVFVLILHHRMGKPHNTWKIKPA